MDSLPDCGALFHWCATKLAYSEPALAGVRQWALAEPAASQHLFELALAMREALHRIFSALATGQPVPAPDLAALNQALAEAPPRGELALAGGAYFWRVASLTPTVPALLGPVLWSAADLLTRVAPLQVRQCANPQCLRLFVDASKGGTRRWCDMNACGNRAKARRHYQKSKQA